MPDIIAPTTVLRLAVWWMRPTTFARGKCHDEFEQHARDPQSGDGLHARRVSRRVRKHEFAVLLLRADAAAGARGRPGHAGDHPSRRTRRPVGPRLVPEPERPGAHREGRPRPMQTAL